MLTCIIFKVKVKLTMSSPFPIKEAVFLLLLKFCFHASTLGTLLTWKWMLIFQLRQNLLITVQFILCNYFMPVQRREDLLINMNLTVFVCFLLTPPKSLSTSSRDTLWNYSSTITEDSLSRPYSSLCSLLMCSSSRFPGALSLDHDSGAWECSSSLSLFCYLI